MKTFDVSETDVSKGIKVEIEPYPHIVLGEGGHKRATWVALGKRDAENVVKTKMLPCPKQGSCDYSYTEVAPTETKTCDKCGQKYGQWDGTSYKSVHPQAGEVRGPQIVEDIGIIALKDEKGESNGKYLVVAPRNGDDRILVLWRVSSGYRGGAGITADEGVTVIGYDHAWASGRGSLGETAEMLAILKPGQELHASRSGRCVQDTKATLTYNKEIKVVFGGEELDAATADEVEGDYL